MRKAVILFVLSASGLFAQSAESTLQEYFQQGEQALAEGHYAEAEAAYQKLKRLAPNVAEVYGRLGLVYFQERRYGEAVPALRQALKLKPSLPNTDVLLAMSLSEMGQYSEAVTGLEKGFRKTNDQNLKRLSGLQLERVYTGLHRDGDAVQVALELSRLYPNDPEILYHSGRLFGNFAYLSMQKLTEVAPDSVWRREAGGDAFQSDGKYELAAAEFRQVLKMEPNRSGIHYRLGRALLGAGDKDAAAAEFQQELTLDPTNANAAYELAEIHRKAAEYPQARESFTAALKYYPEFEEANVGLARTLISEARPREALPYLERALQLDKRDAVAYYQLAQAYKALGEAEQQRKALERFQQLRATEAHAELLHGQASVSRQELDAAAP